MNGLEKEHGHTRVGLYVQAMAKWLAVALVTGVCCGVVGSLFHIGVERATELREQHPWLLWCLPAAGLVIVAFYKLTKTEGQGTNDIIDAVHHGKPLSIWLLPAIFLGTILTHLCGGSAGREGAALQMGGTIGRHAGNLFNLDDRDLRTATMAGMAAFFSALFGTPLTATVFAIVVISIGVVYHVAFIPCLTASLVAYWISVELGVAPTRFSVAAPELEKLMLLRVAVLGVGCALVSVLLCRTLHFAEHQMKKRLPNAWLRVLVGGGAVIALTYLCGTRDYNGAGMDLITAAVEQGTARPEAFLLKILFTAVTLSAGFKGGEVVPSFFVVHTYYWGDRHHEIFLGPDRAGRINPLRSALERRIPFTNHNDSAVTPMDPLLSVWSAVNRRTASGRVLGEEQTIPVLEALRSVTTWGAWQFHEERIKGSLEPGKLADMTILAENPLAVAPRRLRDISVVGVLVGNELVFGEC